MSFYFIRRTFSFGLQEICKRRLWDKCLSPQGPCWGNLVERLLHHGLRETGKRRIWRGSVSLSLYGGSERGTWKGTPLLGTLKDM
jgi:hypothetical protein